MSPSLLPADWLQQPPELIASLAPLQAVDWAPFTQRNISLSIKREDLLGVQLGGNKVYKLYGHLHKARELFGSRFKLASFGGPWSNHLYALGALAQQQGIPVLAVVRGEHAQQPSAMLRDIQAAGVRIEYVNRNDFRQLKLFAAHRDFTELNKRFGECYWIPEGGGGVEGTVALPALREAILQQSSRPVDVLAHACGTGTSLAGLMRGASGPLSFQGVAVLKTGDGLKAEVSGLLDEFGENNPPYWEIDDQSHCGGYAKLPGYLLDFIHCFEGETGVALDPVYTAKLMYGLTRMAEEGKWQAGTHIVAVHSGGLQGRRGWPCFQAQNASHSS